jgi:hypothetical protein
MPPGFVTGDINEDGAGITKISDGDNLDPSGAQTRAIDLSQPGAYSCICNLPGHFRQGMVKTFTVAPTLPTGAITLTDFNVGTGTQHFTPGRYDSTVANRGPSQHELLVFRTSLPPANFPKESDGSVQENGPGLDKISDGDNIDPGKTQDRVVDLSQPEGPTSPMRFLGRVSATANSTSTSRTDKVIPGGATHVLRRTPLARQAARRTGSECDVSTMRMHLPRC